MQCKLPSSSLNAPISPLAALLKFPPRGLISFSLNYNYFGLKEIHTEWREAHEKYSSSFFLSTSVLFLLQMSFCLYFFFFFFCLFVWLNPGESVGQTEKAARRVMQPSLGGSRLALALWLLCAQLFSTAEGDRSHQGGAAAFVWGRGRKRVSEWVNEWEK